jgi:hypothetical protein
MPEANHIAPLPDLLLVIAGLDLVKPGDPEDLDPRDKPEGDRKE